MAKLNVAVTGLGFIGAEHVEALRRLGYVNVKALCEVEGAQKKAEAMSIDKAYDDYQELLKDDTIDVVHICTPNNLHHSMAKEALLSGKHVVLEKPFAMTTAEGEELLKIAKESDLSAAIHFNIRFYPLVQHAKEMIKNGELGEILAINGSYQQDWLFKETDYNWRLEPEYSGESRAVADIGSHWLDLVEYMTGNKVQKVCADFCTFYPVRKKPKKAVETYSGKMLQPSDYEDIKIETEDYATVLLRFNNGAHGSMTLNQVAAGRKNRIYFEVYGTKGSIAWDGEKPNELWVGSRDNNNELMLKDPSLMKKGAVSYANYPGGHTEGFPDTSKQLFNNFYQQILTGEEKDFPTFEDGMRELVLTEAIVNSAKEEKWIKL